MKENKIDNRPASIIEENDEQDKIFRDFNSAYNCVIDKNGFYWNYHKFHDEKNKEYDNYYIEICINRIEGNENEKGGYYKLFAKEKIKFENGDETLTSETNSDALPLLGTINFDELSETTRNEMDKMINSQQKKPLKLICGNVYYEDNKCMSWEYSGDNGDVKYKYLLYITDYEDTCLMYNVIRAFSNSHVLFLKNLYLRMFCPVTYKCREEIAKRNDRIEINFYYKRKKILLGEGLAYVILLVACVVAMAFSLINLMVFIITALILTVIFVAGLLYEFKLREIPYISELPQEEIEKIKKQIEQEKNRNKDQTQDKNEKDDKKEEDENLMEINTDSHKRNKESLVDKINNISEINKEQENDSKPNKSGVFSLTNNEKDKTDS